MDSRFKFSEAPKWLKQAKNQKLLATELVTIQAITPSSTLYEFDLPNNSVLLFGPQAGFRVQGVFEQRDAPTNVAPNPRWDVVPLDDYTKVVVQPNWFEHLVKSVDVFHKNTSIKNHDVPKNVDPFVNTYLYSVMDPAVKKCLCPEACNPGNGVPADGEKWDSTANSKWHQYSKTIFNNGTLTFRYIPPFVFPFYQQSNFCGHGRPPTALLMPLLEKVRISLTLQDDMKGVFKNKADNTKEYRFRIKKLELVAEEARLNPTFEKQLLSSKNGSLYYPGVTKNSITEHIGTGAFTHICKFQDVLYPEGIFIFALPKTVVGNQFKYKDVTDTNASILSDHNIESVDIKFQNKSLALKSPNIYGSLSDHVVEIKQFIDHLEHPPFGVLQKMDNVTLEMIKDGGKTSKYPHFYVNLCPSGPQTRIIPIGDDGSSISKPGELSIEIKFKEDGAKDATYFVYIFYTDVTFEMDMKTKEISTYYKRSKPNN